MFLSPFGRTICYAVRFGRNVVELMLLLLSNNNQAAEVAAIAKNFSISIHRTLQAIKLKLAATLFTFAATFCSIIIAAHNKNMQSPLKFCLALIKQIGNVH